MGVDEVRDPTPNEFILGVILRSFYFSIVVYNIIIFKIILENKLKTYI